MMISCAIEILINDIIPKMTFVFIFYYIKPILHVYPSSPEKLKEFCRSHTDLPYNGRQTLHVGLFVELDHKVGP